MSCKHHSKKGKTEKRKDKHSFNEIYLKSPLEEKEDDNYKDQTFQLVNQKKRQTFYNYQRKESEKQKCTLNFQSVKLSYKDSQRHKQQKKRISPQVKFKSPNDQSKQNTLINRNLSKQKWQKIPSPQVRQRIYQYSNQSEPSGINLQEIDRTTQISNRISQMIENECIEEERLVDEEIQLSLQINRRGILEVEDERFSEQTIDDSNSTLQLAMNEQRFDYRHP